MAAGLRFRWERAIRRAPRASVPPTRKFVALLLATYANADGTEVRPGTGELMTATGYTDRCVQGHVRALRKDGWLVRTFRGSSAGRGGKVDEYRLSLPGSPSEQRNAGAGDPQSDPGGTPEPGCR